MNPELVDAISLDHLADRLGMRGLLPHLVRRMLGATPGVGGCIALTATPLLERHGTGEREGWTGEECGDDAVADLRRRGLVG